MINAEMWDFSRCEWEQLIDSWIFSERDRAVIKRRLLDGITFERLSEEFDISTRQAVNIVHKCNERILKCIDKKGKI